MDLALQAKLLKLLEEKTVRRIGSLRDYRVNIRIIAATHRPLEQLAQEGKFRSDLFFRLRIIHLQVPPLRERGNDILLLANSFLQIQGARYRKLGLTLSAEVQAILVRHRWSGNVRELRNIIEQAVLLTRGRTIEPMHINLSAIIGAPAEGIVATDEAFIATERFPSDGLPLADIERGLLLKALQKTNWNVTRAGKLLGLSRDTMRYRIDQFQPCLSGCLPMPLNVGFRESSSKPPRDGRPALSSKACEDCRARAAVISSIVRPTTDSGSGKQPDKHGSNLPRNPDRSPVAAINGAWQRAVVACRPSGSIMPVPSHRVEDHPKMGDSTRSRTGDLPRLDQCAEPFHDCYNKTRQIKPSSTRETIPLVGTLSARSLPGGQETARNARPALPVVAPQDRYTPRRKTTSTKE